MEMRTPSTSLTTTSRAQQSKLTGHAENPEARTAQEEGTGDTGQGSPHIKASIKSLVSELRWKVGKRWERIGELTQAGPVPESIVPKALLWNCLSSIYSSIGQAYLFWPEWRPKPSKATSVRLAGHLSPREESRLRDFEEGLKA
jgi:hypothetical protein